MMCSGAKNQVVFAFLYLLQSTVPNAVSCPGMTWLVQLMIHQLYSVIHSDSTGHAWAQPRHGGVLPKCVELQGRLLIADAFCIH
jgi:hypothetical protein